MNQAHEVFEPQAAIPVRCSVCKRFKGAPREFRLDPDARASDGCCGDCWGPYRKSLGLPERPYQGSAW